MWTVNRANPSELASTAVGPTPDGVKAVLSPLGQYVMLYDLKGDPGETTNLAKARPEVVARLQAKLATWDKANVPPQWTSMRQAVRRLDGELVKLYP